ncbi:MAG: glyoxalase [Microbacterium sp. SCN 70-27]|nr:MULTISPECIES: VOC family protein [unclassified Microbacterium]MBN9224700.1 VOC family protein [Microbacterium sp.]ODT28280.1 MAG: glyoxalase [Microbacterium sp. SCN 70-27]
MHNLEHDIDVTVPASAGVVHHLELRTADLAAAAAAWAWLLGELGYAPYQTWPEGRSWRKGDTYLVVEAAPLAGAHDRRMPGLSHLALHAGPRAIVDRLWASATDHGWARLYEDRHPFAGGEGHYAAFLENAERFKVELVAEA